MLLDTHTLVWLDEGSQRLGEQARQQIDSALQEGTLFVSALSFWEVAMLVSKGRLECRIEIDLWRKSLLDSGLQEIKLDGDIAIRAALLRAFHGDPADRIIVATARQIAAPLCTADEKILAWNPEELSCLDARK